jgi:hypothetical protein
MQLFLHVQALILYKRSKGHYIHIGTPIYLLIYLWHWFSCIKLTDGDSQREKKLICISRDALFTLPISMCK